MGVRCRFVYGVSYMFYWWRDIVREAEYQGHHTPIVQIGMRYGMIFLFALRLCFLSLFLGFFDSSLYPDTGVWPPEGIVALDPFDLPLINTLILLLSGCTVTWSHHALQHDNRKDFITGLVLTIILGAIFTAFKHMNISMPLLRLLMEFMLQLFIWLLVSMDFTY